MGGEDTHEGKDGTYESPGVNESKDLRLVWDSFIQSEILTTEKRQLVYRISGRTSSFYFTSVVGGVQSGRFRHRTSSSSSRSEEDSFRRRRGSRLSR